MISNYELNFLNQQSPLSRPVKRMRTGGKHVPEKTLDLRGRRSLTEIFELVIENEPKEFTLRHEELPEFQ